jgi:membrane fusion protein (multidrug efflux system)
MLMKRWQVVREPGASARLNRAAATVGLLAASLALSGCGKTKATGGPAAGATPEVAVVVVQPQRVEISSELPGRVSALLVAEVRPQVSGIIQERLFDEGSDVKAGAVLYGIAPGNYQTACTTATAAVAVAKANLGTAQAAVATAKAAQATALAVRDAAKASLASAKAARSRAEASAVPLRLRAERFRDLAASKAVSQQDYDDVCAALKQAEAGIEGAAAGIEGATAEGARAEAAILAAEADSRRAEAAVQGAQAAIGSAEAGLEAAQTTLGYTRVTAPISGRIGRSTVTIGALATAYQPVPLTTIQQLDQVYVDVPQASANLLRLKRNLASGHLTRDDALQTKVRLFLEDGTPYAAEGTLKFSDVSVDPSTASFILRLVFPNPDGVLLPGMFVRVAVSEGANDQAIMVPQQAVTRDPKGNPVALIVDAAGKAAERRLTLDRAIGDQWLVAAGLAAGDRVIVEGMQRARPGTAVKDVPFAAPGAPAPQPADPAKPAPTAN